MNIDAAVFSGGVAIILAIVALGFWAGRLTERIKSAHKRIDDAYKDIDLNRIENSREHGEMMELIASLKG